MMISHFKLDLFISEEITILVRPILVLLKYGILNIAYKSQVLALLSCIFLEKYIL